MHTSTSFDAAQILEITGADAINFLHRQCSSPVMDLTDGHWQLSAWLDPQGRVRYLFQLGRISAERILILLRGGDAAEMAQALRPFIFRSKLSITVINQQRLATGPALGLHQLQLQPDQSLQWGFGDHSLHLNANTSDQHWLAPQTSAGWPWLTDAARNQHVAAALSLHRLGAVAVDKGCYPGQEIVARLHFRGGLKRHLTLLEVQAPDLANAPELHIGGTAGQLLNHAELAKHDQVLAVVADQHDLPGLQRIHNWGP